MTFSGHIAVTALLLRSTTNPWVLILLPFVLHLAADAVPHAEWQRWPEAALQAKLLMAMDALLAIGLTVTCFLTLRQPGWLIGASLFSGLLPDLTDRLARRHAKRFRYLHDWSHTLPVRPGDHVDWQWTWTGRTSVWVKIAVQTLLVASAELVLLQ